MTAIQHLHHETKFLPTRRHIRLKAVQHQLVHHLEGHPARPTGTAQETLFSSYERYVTALLETSDSEEEEEEEEEEDNDDIGPPTHVTEECCRGLLKKLHTNEVKDVLDNRDNNKVLDEPPLN